MMDNFNIQNWPFVYLRFNNIINDDLYDEYKKNYLNLLIKCKNQNEKMILICNLGDTIQLPIPFLIKQMQFNQQIFKFNKEYLQCVCILCKNKNLKNILKLYLSMTKQASPYKICSNTDKINKYITEKSGIVFNFSLLEDIQNEIITEEENEISNLHELDTKEIEKLLYLKQNDTKTTLENSSEYMYLEK